MPMTAMALRAFQAQYEATPGSEYLFPSVKRTGRKPYITSVKKIWKAPLRARQSAELPTLCAADLATRLSAGEVADHFVTQMLRQGDAAVFKAVQPSEAKYDAGSAESARPVRQ